MLNVYKDSDSEFELLHCDRISTIVFELSMAIVFYLWKLKMIIIFQEMCRIKVKGKFVENFQ